MAVDFPGGSALLIPSTPFVGLGAGFTAAGWFRSNSATANQCLLTIRSDNNNRFSLIASGNIAGDPLRLQAVESNATNSADSTTGYTAGTSHHACMIVESATLRRVLLDGGSAASATLSRNPVLSNIVLGAVTETPTQPMNGRMWDWAIWNTILDPVAEVPLLAKGVHPFMIRPQALVAYWPFAGAPYNDWVGGFNPTTVVGSPLAAPNPRSIMLPFQSRLGGMPLAQVIVPATSVRPSSFAHYQHLLVR